MADHGPWGASYKSVTPALRSRADNADRKNTWVAAEGADAELFGVVVLLVKLAVTVGARVVTVGEGVGEAVVGETVGLEVTASVANSCSEVGATVIVAIWRSARVCAKMRPLREDPVLKITSVLTKRMPSMWAPTPTWT